MKRKLYPNLQSLVISAIIGIIIGLLGGPAWVLVPWALMGLAVGYVAATKKAALANGAVYGFMLAYFFMVGVYNGSAPLASKLLPFVLFGLFGAVAGLSLGLIGNMLPHKSSK